MKPKRLDIMTAFEKPFNDTVKFSTELFKNGGYLPGQSLWLVIDGKQNWSKYFELKSEIHGNDKSKLLDVIEMGNWELASAAEELR